MPERADLLCERHVSLGDLPFQNAAAGIQQHPQIKRGVEHLHTAGLDFGHIQHVVHQREQVGRRAAHLGYAVLDTCFIVKIFLGNVQHTHNAVDGRADIVGHIRQKFRLGSTGFLGLVQGLLGLGAETAAAQHQPDADDRGDNAQVGQYNDRRILVRQAHQREFLRAQVDIFVGDGDDLGVGQAVYALVQHTAQQHVVIAVDADAKTAPLVAEHRPQLVLFVVKDGPLGLVGIRVVGVNFAAVQRRQAVIEGIHVLDGGAVVQAGQLQRVGVEVVGHGHPAQVSVVAAQQHPGKLRREVAVRQFVAAILGGGKIAGQINDKIRRAVIENLLVLGAVSRCQELVVQPGAARHELKEVYHDAGQLAVLVQIGVGVAVRVGQHGELLVRCIVGRDVVFLSSGQVELVAGVDVLIVLVKQGRAPGGVVAVHTDQRVVDKPQGRSIAFAHGNVDVLIVKGVDDPFVGGLAHPVGDCRRDGAAAQCGGKLLIGVKIDRRVSKAVFLSVGLETLVAAVAAAAHTDDHAVKRIIVARHDAAVAGLDGQHCGYIGDRLVGEVEALGALVGLAQRGQQVNLAALQHIGGLVGITVVSQILKLYILMLGNALQYLVGIAAAVAVLVHDMVARVGVKAYAQGAPGRVIAARRAGRHGKAQ